MAAIAKVLLAFKVLFLEGPEAFDRTSDTPLALLVGYLAWALLYWLEATLVAILGLAADAASCCCLMALTLFIAALLTEYFWGVVEVGLG